MEAVKLEKPKLCWLCLSDNFKKVNQEGEEWWRCQKCGTAVLARQPIRR